MKTTAKNMLEFINKSPSPFHTVKNVAEVLTEAGFTRLYEGDTEAFAALIAEYKAEMEVAPESAEDKDTKTKAYWQEQIEWLTSRFPEGVYRDVVGLCKAAKIEGEDGIKDQDYSLNPGRYVGVVIEDDGMTVDEFKAEMLLLNEELAKLNSEAHKLEEKISNNLQELFQ